MNNIALMNHMKALRMKMVAVRRDVIISYARLYKWELSAVTLAIVLLVMASLGHKS